MDELKKSLPGWLYIIVGLAFMGYVKFIESRQPSAKIGIFSWIGVLFIVFGALREFIPRLAARKPKKELVGAPPPQYAAMHQAQSHLHPAGHATNGVSPQASHQHVQTPMHTSYPYQPLHKQCPRCHQLTHGQGRFCHNCGFQFY